MLAVVAVNLGLIGFAACGARSDLPLSEQDETSEGGGGSSPRPDAGPDAPPDAPEDVPTDRDPPPPPPDDCKDPSTTFIYLVTSELDLYSFNPKNLAFTQIGALDCPAPLDATPFSMGVDRTGTAFVLYSDGSLFRVDTADASCEETDFQPNQFGFRTFGMGYALDEPMGLTDSLFVAEINFQSPSLGLASVDTETMELSPIGPFSENPANAIEMTGSSDGALYGYFLSDSGGWVVEIDKETAEILDSTFVPVGQSGALAFAFWGGEGGDFYIFTSPGNANTTVTRYRPSDGSVSALTTLGRTVVGAGVSTCDPRAFD